MRHFLVGETVVARRGSRGYRIRSLLRRYRWAFAIITLVLVLGIAEVTMRVQQLTAERDQANAVAGFLRGVISDLDPGTRNITDANHLTVLEVLDAGRTRLDQETIEPTLRAQLLVQLAQSYAGLLEWLKSTAAARDALALTTRHQLSSTLEFEAKLALALADTVLQHYDDAEKMYLDMLRRKNLVSHAKGLVHHGYGNMLYSQGRMPEAEKQLKLATQVLSASSDPASLMAALRRLATTSDSLGRQEGALDAARQALEIAREHFPENQVSLALSETTYATLLGTSQPEAAQPILKNVMQRFRRVLGADNHDTRATESNYALLLWKLHRYDEAEELLRSNIQRREAASGKDSWRQARVGRIWPHCNTTEASTTRVYALRARLLRYLIPPCPSATCNVPFRG